MRQPVQHGAGQSFAAKHFRPLLKRQIRGYDYTGTFIGRAHDVEEQLRAQFAGRDVALFVEYQEV